MGKLYMKNKDMSRIQAQGFHHGWAVRIPVEQGESRRGAGMIDERALRDHYIIIIGCLHFSAAEDSEKMAPINIQIVIKEHRVYAPPYLPLQGPILNIHAVGSGRALSSMA
ncbi:hypothetical protein MAP00_000447 [Monascus purpureus]|nr:hypothetical protein MAP00_000447 [Monascus purpureus]